MRVPLNEHGTVILDINGNGTASVGPLTAREVWYPENVHVSTFQNAGTVTNEAQAQIFAGIDTSQPNFIDGTQSGSTGDSSDRINARVIRIGQKVFGVWTGGDPNITAVISVTGNKDV